MSFECLANLRFFFRHAREAGTLSLWHHDYDGEMTEALFFQFIGQHCFSGGRFVTAWEGAGRPLAGMLCEDVLGNMKAKQAHFLTAMRPKDKADMKTLFEGCRAGIEYAFEVLGAGSLMGFIPVVNQGALKFCERLGFEVRRVVKGCCYIDRLKRSVDGYLASRERGY